MLEVRVQGERKPEQVAGFRLEKALLQSFEVGACTYCIFRQRQLFSRAARVTAAVLFPLPCCDRALRTKQIVVSQRRRLHTMPKVQPPELKGFMDKKLSSAFTDISPGPSVLDPLGHADAPGGHGSCWRLRSLRCDLCGVSTFTCIVHLQSRILRLRACHALPTLLQLRGPVALRSAVALNANRHVTGTLRGFDQFMNLVLDNTVDDKTKSDIGMVVSSCRGGVPGKVHVSTDYSGQLVVDAAGSFRDCSTVCKSGRPV